MAIKIRLSFLAKEVILLYTFSLLASVQKRMNVGYICLSFFRFSVILAWPFSFLVLRLAHIEGHEYIPVMEKGFPMSVYQKALQMSRTRLYKRPKF